MRNISYWIIDYLYLIWGKLLMYIYKNPPKQYLSYTVKGKNPVIIIPGNSNKWGFLKKLADTISDLGHPVYIPHKLGSNLFDIPTSAKIIRRVIDENNLKNVILLGHSKGGVVGKYILIHENQDTKIKRLIAIGAPFSGTNIVTHLPFRSFRELSPKSKIIQEMNSNSKVNSKIVSIMPEFDNHVWSDKGSYLQGALNIKLPIRGHHKIVFDKASIDKAIEQVGKIN